MCTSHRFTYNTRRSTCYQVGNYNIITYEQRQIYTINFSLLEKHSFVGKIPIRCQSCFYEFTFYYILNILQLAQLLMLVPYESVGLQRVRGQRNSLIQVKSLNQTYFQHLGGLLTLPNLPSYLVSLEYLLEMTLHISM